MYKVTSYHPQRTKWDKLNNPPTDLEYRGRFAPSPTGNLHFGSLLAALASYCQARANNGQWLLRIEDLDRPRTIDGAAQAIINTLEKYGMTSDQPVIFQSHEAQQQRYLAALKQLQNQQLCYPCSCNRKTLLTQKTYPKTCRQKNIDLEQPHSVRLKTTAKDFLFNDLIQGLQKQNITQQCGDFNIVRKDRLIAYQLAVVVDDQHQQISQVVRGIDILDSTARQMLLIEKLGYRQPEYAHIPLATQQDGRKLSKQNHAPEIHNQDPYLLTFTALQVLGQNPPKLKAKSQKKLMQWAIDNWSLTHIPKTQKLPPK